MKSMPVTPPSDNRIAQLIDANLDRAREGLRVMEDWCRFGLKRKDFSIQIKDWRHQLSAHHHIIYRKARLTSRDPAMGVSHPLQKNRLTPEAIFIANSSRVQEALRVIEEFTRITDPKLSEVASKIRYESYEFEIKVLDTKEEIVRRKILKDCSLYLLTSNKKNLKEIVLQALDAGIKIVQYREKFLNDIEKINQAKELASLCKKYNSLFIVNDRVDIALAVEADGIHLGQEDIPTKIARELLGPEKIIGISTHCIEDIKNAEKENCDYIGIGPIFPSETKKKLHPIGIDYLRKGLNETLLPAFAIGGINSSNINKLNQIKKLRIAVSDAIINSNDPFSKTEELFKLLK
ncbi:thiamine phosphate synthase [Prochlorococcus marinus]|uniref:Thiamine-phosphate synthase n=1 Tax=Prochlorococcus marinus XMU1408 TaxID=2213228 RepID=A0A318R2S4_PROMR|nr:thiamine phosphate synthase [Prochlorococcus marinus]MBW3042455.1 thiamine phosphate synthase [Prochlorococcus marinus str. XMU1408]PYE01190.1 thiamine phosphate synthase [Prochlorococcus marinus XMU1408]